MTTAGDSSGPDEAREEPTPLDLSGSIEAAGGMGGPFMAAPPGADGPGPAGDPSVDLPPDPPQTDPDQTDPGGQRAAPDLGPPPAPGERPDGYDPGGRVRAATGSGADGGLEAGTDRPDAGAYPGGGHPAGGAGAGSSGMLDSPAGAVEPDVPQAGPAPSTSAGSGPVRRLREVARRRPALFLAGAVVVGAAARRIVAVVRRNGR